MLIIIFTKQQNLGTMNN